MRHRAFVLGIVTAAVLGGLSLGAAADQKTVLTKSAPPPAAKASAASAPAPVPLPPDDPAKVEAARNFLIAYHPVLDPKNIAASIEKRLPIAVKNEQGNNPKLDVKKFEAATRKKYTDLAMNSLGLQAHVISRHFTLQELNDLTTFFHGPLGGKLASESHRISVEMMMEKRAKSPTKMFPVKIK